MDLTSLTQMNESRKTAKYCDFSVMTEGKTFPVHRLVLGSCSEYFRLLFNSEMKETEENKTHEKEVTVVGVERAIGSMYGEKLGLDENNVTEVLKVCHRWQLASAVQECETFLIRVLNIDNCIMWKKLVALYSLQNLQQECRNFVLDNLKLFTICGKTSKIGSDEVREILKAAQSRDVTGAKDLWEFCLDWSEKQAKKDQTIVCRTLCDFPSLHFKSIMFNETVWNGVHLMNCVNCNKHFADVMLQSVTKKDINEQNCIIIKYRAKRLHYPDVEKMADDFIINCGNLFAHLDVEEDDLVKYTNMSRTRYTNSELHAVLQWMQHVPGRDKIFPTILSIESSQRGSIQKTTSSISKRQGFNTAGVWFQRRFEKTREWRMKDFFYIKELAEKHDAAKAKHLVDQFIVKRYDEVSKMPQFKELQLKEVKKYATSAHKWPERIQWDAVSLWVTHNPSERRKDFLELLKCLPMNQFSTSFLKNTILKCSLVEENNSLLMEIMIDRVMKLEEVISYQRKRIEVIEERTSSVRFLQSAATFASRVSDDEYGFDD